MKFQSLRVEVSFFLYALSLSIILFWLIDILHFNLLMVLGLGGGIATIFGLVDDILDIKVSIKLCAQLFFKCMDFFMDT